MHSSVTISFRGKDMSFNTDLKTHHWEHLRQAITESPDAILTDEQKEVNNIISRIISGKVTL